MSLPVNGEGPLAAAAKARPIPRGPDAAFVQELFARIAHRYDLCNHLLSAGIDRRWRRRLVRELGLPRGSRVLDVACGTGDLTAEISAASYKAMGVDFCLPMTARAREKTRLPILAGDALRLPFRDGCLDGITVAFGIRNFEDPVEGLREIARVLRPSGTFACLEFGLPDARLPRWLYLAYFRHALPAIGHAVSGDAAAYRHLRDSVQAFPHGRDFERLLTLAGLYPSRTIRLSLGIAYLYLAQGPG